MIRSTENSRSSCQEPGPGSAAALAAAALAAAALAAVALASGWAAATACARASAGAEQAGLTLIRASATAEIPNEAASTANAGDDPAGATSNPPSTGPASEPIWIVAEARALPVGS